jgi:hypothetical protein
MSTKGRQQMKTKITLRALEQRIGRQLSKDNQSLHVTRIRRRTIESLGPYYIVNENTNSIAAQGIDPDQLVEIGKEMGALSSWEKVEI